MISAEMEREKKVKRREKKGNDDRGREPRNFVFTPCS